jgi:hypothetical protein
MSKHKAALPRTYTAATPHNHFEVSQRSPWAKKGNGDAKSPSSVQRRATVVFPVAAMTTPGTTTHKPTIAAIRRLPPHTAARDGLVEVRRPHLGERKLVAASTCLPQCAVCADLRCGDLFS